MKIIYNNNKDELVTVGEQFMEGSDKDNSLETTAREHHQMEV